MRSWMIFILVVCAVSSQAQSWISEYDKGLEASRKGDWIAARAAFQQAVAYRPEDTDKATTLPGPVTEVRRWRNGVPYSPNFLAAYAAYRNGMSMKDAERSTALGQAASEFEILLEKGQASRETFYLLNAIYGTLGDTAKRQSLEAKFSKLGGKASFRVDDEVMSPEEKSSVANIGGAGKSNTPPVITIPSTSQKNPSEPIKIGSGGALSGGSLNPLVGPVAPISTKYALIIGNGDSKMKDLAVPYGADDAQLLREGLVTHAGYPEGNIDLVLNATADQIMKSAEALAQRVDENATILIYFSGVGVNVGGKDFLAGIDTESAMETGSMVPKAKLFDLFLSRGSRVYSFFQVNRPVAAGRYFGQEVPMVGQLSQMQACIPNASVYPLVQNRKTVGLFTFSMIRVMADLRSNQLPILEFGWQVFNKMRKGDSGTFGGSSVQVCTLPVLTNIASDSRF